GRLPHENTHIQRLTRIRFTTPAKDHELAQKHNVAMYRWAESQEDLVLVAGHTHRPVFLQGRSKAHVEALLEDERRSPTVKPQRLAELSAELEWMEVLERHRLSEGEGALPNKPCYFNTGCCSFSDGDATGLEFSEGKIRLVRWLNDAGEPKPKVLAESDMKQEIFGLLQMRRG
ncbi:MAG: hypothetical protein R6W82_02210, partial [bacterium]